MRQNQYYSFYNHDKANVIPKLKDLDSVTNCISLTNILSLKAVSSPNSQSHIIDFMSNSNVPLQT